VNDLGITWRTAGAHSPPATAPFLPRNRGAPPHFTHLIPVYTYRGTSSWWRRQLPIRLTRMVWALYLNSSLSTCSWRDSPTSRLVWAVPFGARGKSGAYDFRRMTKRCCWCRAPDADETPLSSAGFRIPLLWGERHSRLVPWAWLETSRCAGAYGHRAHTAFRDIVYRTAPQLLRFACWRSCCRRIAAESRGALCLNTAQGGPGERLVLSGDHSNGTGMPSISNIVGVGTRGSS